MVNHSRGVLAKDITAPDAKNAKIKVLIGPDEGWDNHVMREIIVDSGGYTPHHQHAWPHINYILEGAGALRMEEDVFPVVAGSYAYVPAHTMHQFQNTGTEPFRFICIVPIEGHR
ncbi:MAG: cupin domain-containing protein [Candidatus Izemoplasmatales bacterium]|nr:cupin domain-containing protein [Candidatus Izemoplasmatales bacterium]